MNNQTDMNRGVIEYLVSLLNSPLKTNPDMDGMPDDWQSAESSLSMEPRDIQAALNFRNFIDEMPGGFFLYHADGNEEIIYANKAVLRLFQCGSMEEFRELTGNSFRGIVHPDDLDAVEQSIQKQIKDSQYDLDYVEYRIIPKDGSIRWVDDYGHLIRDTGAGDIFYVFIGDATEKKQRQMKEKITEQQLQSQLEEYGHELNVIHQEQLRRLEVIEGLSIDYESIFYADLDTDRIQAYRVNKQFQTQFPECVHLHAFCGFDADYIERWVCPDDREILRGVTSPEYIRGKLAHRKSFHLNYRIMEGGKTAYMQIRIVNVGSSGHISQIVIGYRNVDNEIIQEIEQKQNLADALKEANLASKAKSLFLSNMSHDIRTPMNAIVGFTSLVKKHMDDKERVLGYLDSISNSSDQLLQLLNSVLEISRIESGKVQIEENECSLSDIAHQIQIDAISQAARKNITVSLDISRLNHDHVCTDRKKLNSILTCLSDNAVKYTPENGYITISVKEQEGFHDGQADYQFAVEDSGIGIDPDFIERLFQPFEREKNTTLSGIYGTGLGLAIARDLAEMLGGTIAVSSTAGTGSKFTVTLPLHIKDPAEEHDACTESIPGGSAFFSNTKRILVVDDNEINLEIENEVLKDAGFKVDCAENGRIAVEKVKSSAPGYYDLILMDIQMPVMDGYHATMAIREMENPALAGIPIIAVSANTFEEDKRKAMESGMNAHLPKPLDTPRLYRMIQKFLQKK